MSTRKYTLKRRAEQQAQTRDRIVEAAVALHEEVGPKETTVSAIAARAKVQRLTVYRHFPDDASLLQACSSRWIERNPPPAAECWSAIAEPTERAVAALKALYVYYRDTQRMWRQVYRDRDEVPALRAIMDGFESYLEELGASLGDAWKVPQAQRREIGYTLTHALRFSTWDSLQQTGLADRRMAQLVGRWLACLGEARPTRLRSAD